MQYYRNFCVDEVGDGYGWTKNEENIFMAIVKPGSWHAIMGPLLSVLPNLEEIEMGKYDSPLEIGIPYSSCCNQTTTV